MPFSFIHAADIHLDSPLVGLEGYDDAPVDEIREATRRAFDNLISCALERKVDFVLLVGDLFDVDWRDYSTGLYFIDRLSRLGRQGIRVFLVSGNHDAASQISKKLRLPENVYSFSSQNPESVFLDDLGCVIHGQSYANRSVEENLARNFPKADSTIFNIGMLHTSLTGREGHERYAPCTLDDLKNKGYDYWALGHVHGREIVSNNPIVLFPGCIQGRHMREVGAKGATYVQVKSRDEINLKAMYFDTVRWYEGLIDIEGARSIDEVLDACRNKIHTFLTEGEGRILAVRIRLIGETALHTQMIENQEHLIESIRAILISIGEVWLEKVFFDTQSQTHGIRERSDPVQCVLTAIEKSSFLFEDIEAVRELRNKLPYSIQQRCVFLGEGSQKEKNRIQDEILTLLEGRLGHV